MEDVVIQDGSGNTLLQYHGDDQITRDEVLHDLQQSVGEGVLEHKSYIVSKNKILEGGNYLYKQKLLPAVSFGNYPEPGASAPGVLRTASLGELIEELVKARGMEEVDFHMLHNSGPALRRNGPIIPDNRGIVHSIGDCFRWEEREQFVEEFYASQYDIKERAMHRKKTPGVDTTNNRDVTFESFIGQRGSGKSATVRMLAAEMDRLAKAGGIPAVRSQSFAASIIESFGKPRKLFFMHDFSLEAERPTPQLLDELKAPVLLAVLLLRAVLGTWYTGAPTFVQLCQWASVTPGIGVFLDVPGVLRWVASKFPGVSPETLHSIFVLDEVHALSDSRESPHRCERAVFRQLNSHFTQAIRQDQGGLYVCLLLCTTTFDPDYSDRVLKRKRNSDPSVSSPNKSIQVQSGSPTSSSNATIEMLSPTRNCTLLHGPSQSGYHIARTHTINMLSLSATYRIVEDVLTRLGVPGFEGGPQGGVQAEPEKAHTEPPHPRVAGGHQTELQAATQEREQAAGPHPGAPEGGHAGPPHPGVAGGHRPEPQAAPQRRGQAAGPQPLQPGAPEGKQLPDVLEGGHAEPPHPSAAGGHQTKPQAAPPGEGQAVGPSGPEEANAEQAQTSPPEEKLTEQSRAGDPGGYKGKMKESSGQGASTSAQPHASSTEGSRLPAHVKLFVAGSGLGRDIAAAFAAMANAAQIQANERPISSIMALHVPSLVKFVTEPGALSACVRRAEQQWTQIITSINGTLDVSLWGNADPDLRIQYLQALVSVQLAQREVLFTQLPFPEAAFSFGALFAQGLYTFQGDGPIEDLRNAKLRICIPPKHLEILAEQGLSKDDVLEVQDLYLRSASIRESPTDRECEDLSAIKVRACALVSSGVRTATIGDLIGVQRRGQPWDTVVKLPQLGALRRRPVVGHTITNKEYRKMLDGDLPHGHAVRCMPNAPTMDYLAMFELDMEPGSFFAIQGQSKQHVLTTRKNLTGDQCLDLVLVRPKRDGHEQPSEWDKRWRGPEDRFVVVFTTDHDRTEAINYERHTGKNGVEYPALPNLQIITRSEQEEFFGTAPLRRRDLLHVIMAEEYMLSEKQQKALEASERKKAGRRGAPAKRALADVLEDAGGPADRRKQAKVGDNSKEETRNVRRSARLNPSTPKDAGTGQGGGGKGRTGGRR